MKLILFSCMIFLKLSENMPNMDKSIAFFLAREKDLLDISPQYQKKQSLWRVDRLF